jgi:ribosome-binding protein aMBF1 (putative translation factor)
MSFNHQDWTPVIIGKRTRTSENTQTVAKPSNNKLSNGIKVEKIWNPKDPNAEPETRPVMVTHELGQQIQQARTAKSMTQKELANAICIPVSVISDYERGTGVHNSNHISKIKKYLGITKNKV